MRPRGQGIVPSFFLQMLKEKDIQDAISKSSSMKEAATRFGCSFRTFVRNAKKYNLYVPRKGTKAEAIPLQEILDGLHPQYQTSKISKRLVRDGIKEYRCEECKITSYNGKHISLELDHVDGDSKNHVLSNLKLLCPNCHSQTPTYRSKKLVLGFDKSYREPITEDRVRSIRTALREGVKVSEIVRKFHVSRSNVYNIARYRTWKHIN